VQARHEETAALMASGESRFTSEVGVRIATSGPGAVHILNGLYDARLDHRPVLALVGQQARSAMGVHYQQDLDLQSLFKDVAGAYVETASVPEQVPHLINRALPPALASRCRRPCPAGLRCSAADILNPGEKVAMLVGATRSALPTSRGCR
jgi:pyruvate dehydrogenase (quinone)